jgi:integrase
VDAKLMKKDDLPELGITRMRGSKAYLQPDEIRSLTKSKEWKDDTATLYWMWCYFTGMNPTDVAQIKKEDLYQPDGINYHIKFFRQKVKYSASERRPIELYVSGDMLKIIAKLQQRGKEEIKENSSYLFPILWDEMTPLEIRNRTKWWQGYINKRLRKIAKELNIRKLHLGMARHTFATTMSKHNIPVPNISYLMGHSSIVTTQNYLGALTHAEIAQASHVLNNFKKVSKRGRSK